MTHRTPPPQTTDVDALRERAIHAAVIEMSMFGGNLEMKVRKAIERYELILRTGRTETNA